MQVRVDRCVLERALGPRLSTFLVTGSHGLPFVVGQGKFAGEDAALAGQVADVDVTPARLHGLAADGRPGAEAGSVPAAPLAERQEEGFGVLVWQTAALVLDLDEDFPVAGGGAYLWLANS